MWSYNLHLGGGNSKSQETLTLLKLCPDLFGSPGSDLLVWSPSDTESVMVTRYSLKNNSKQAVLTGTPNLDPRPTV